MKPELQVIDDPLGPGPTPKQPAVEQLEPEPEPAAGMPVVERERTEGVFGRVPASLARRLEGAVFDLKPALPGLTRAEVLRALLAEHVDRDAESLARLAELLARWRSRP